MRRELSTFRTGPWRCLAALAFVFALAGCAASGPTAHPRDPLEPMNRAVDNFNYGVDRIAIKPVATVYRDITPQIVRTGVTNFFANLGDAWSAVNNLLQAKVQGTGDSVLRFGFNTLFGFGGLLDWGTEMGIPRHSEDFGQTLGYWGVPSGPYLVLPLLGPSTFRDTAALPVDFKGNLINQVDDIPVRNSLTVLRLVNTRANLLRAGEVLEDAAIDRYTFTRDVYLQVRDADVRDTPRAGAKPPSDDDGRLPE